MSQPLSSPGGPSLPRSGRAPRQAIYWMLTIPHHLFCPFLPDVCSLIKGQLETGAGGFLHWQVLVAFKNKQSLIGVRRIFGPVHAEPTRSSAASDYVWKEDTRVEGTQFLLGRQPFNRSNADHWQEIWDLAVRGAIMEIPADIRVQNYRTLRSITADFAVPVGVVRTCNVYWGRTGTGKSRRAWEEAGTSAYSKDPLSKFWCGYNGQENGKRMLNVVIIDEFRGTIAISHLLRWLDRYPINVEIKGSSVPLRASRLWITSNLNPRAWYPEIDFETWEALERRLIITEI